MRSVGYIVTGGSGDGSSNSLPEDEDEAETAEDQEWGLRKGMELFEVSAKDDCGACAETGGCVCAGCGGG